MTTHQKSISNQERKATRKPLTARPGRQSPAAVRQPADLGVLQRAVADPGRATPGDILALQRAYGNRAVTRLIQAKLTVGPVGDRYEREADRVAERVMGMTVPARERGGRGEGERGRGGETQIDLQRQEEEEELQMQPLAASITPLVQRQAEEEEELQMKPLVQRQAEEEEELQMKPLVQRQVEEEEELQMKPLVRRQAEEEEELQMKPRAGGGFEANPDLERRLTARKGSGSPLPDEIRAFMEPRFGADFSGVQVHTGGEAVQLTREINAQAFTHGQDIYLGAGKYDPGSGAGKRLLAHELTHVVQQTGSRAVAPQSEEAREKPAKITGVGGARLQRNNGPPVSTVGTQGVRIINSAGISTDDSQATKVNKIFDSFINHARANWHYAATGRSARWNDLLESGGTANCGALARAFFELVKSQISGIDAGYDSINTPFVTEKGDLIDPQVKGNVKQFKDERGYDNVKRCVFPMHTRARVANRIFDPTVGKSDAEADIVDFRLRRGRGSIAYETDDYKYKVIRINETPQGFGSAFRIATRSWFTRVFKRLFGGRRR